VQLSPDDLKSIVLRHPRILLYSVDQNLIPKLVFFCLITLRMETFQVSRLLKAYPEFLGYNLDRHILPISRYFLQDLDYSTPEFTKILLTYPRLVTNSLTKIKHVVGYLRFEQDLSASQVRRVLYQAPQILGLNTDVSLRGKVRFLRESLHLETDDDWKRVVSGMPNLLLLSIDKNLQPKISYLLGAFDGNTDVLRAAVVRLPTLLGYSLDKRIIPRMEAIQKAGIDEPGCITVGIPMKEERFQQWLEGRARREEKAMAGPSTMEENSLNSPDETNASKDEASKSVDDDSRSGRIVHWTRDRRLPR
jgi:mTERF domain-containing protein